MGGVNWARVIRGGLVADVISGPTAVAHATRRNSASVIVHVLQGREYAR
jgi:hypothetical protein